MKIVVLDGYALNPGDLSWNDMVQLGDLIVYDRVKNSEIIDKIDDAEIIFTNKTPITKTIIDSCPNIKFIGVLATGYNVVDVEYAASKNIPVCNIPTYGTAAVAQYVFALLLEICHNVKHHSDVVKAGRWSNCKDFCFWDYPLIELAGKTMGIIGFGRIGQNTAKIAKSFGMSVLVYSNHANKDLEDESIKYAAFDKVLSCSDVISLHCPLSDSTREIINKESIAKMKNGAIIINTARGPLINEKDLKDALESGKLYGAALDVVSKEPIEKDNELLGLDNCIITPHIAWGPKEARQRLMDIAVDNLKHFIKGTPTNVVNM
ncbi:MAG: D-2-hydroxyacid dehydrogenase [Clostridia bacterium]|nr:D-2-hydroxyacid dehydrogenase [Clostridia bacterium]